MSLLFESMQLEDKEKRIKFLIEKLVNLHKPKYVDKIEVTVDGAFSEGRSFYYISLTYICSELDSLDDFADESIQNIMFELKKKWSVTLKETIENFLNIKVFVVSSKVKSDKN